MRRIPPALAALAVVASLVAAPVAGSVAAPEDPGRRVIVTLSTEKSADRQEQFLNDAKRAGVRASRTRKFHKLINAVAMTVPATDIARLKAVQGVVAIHNDDPVRAHTDGSVPLVGAPQVWENPGVRGQGMTIAVIDTGVDYTHPDLGGGFGEGHKVVGGYDFVNSDADPMDDNAHGTHVAGIIAGRGTVTGVAPEAEILAYKVMNANGQGYTSDIIAGIEAAADPANPHRADVINLSLGGPGDGTEPLGQAATAAVRAGVVVVASAGNSGPGAGTVSTPAIAEGVIAVGASTSNLRMPVAHIAGANPQLLQSYRGALSANPPTIPATAQLVDAGWGSPEDWERAGDVRGKVVRVETIIAQSQRDLSWRDLELAREAEKRGAIALVGGLSGGIGPSMANVDKPSTGIQASGDSLRMDRLVVMGIDETQFAELSRMLEAGRVDLTISGVDRTDDLASFSSRGPSPHGFELKPDLVAPGVDIRSTVPKSIWAPGEYRLSGTSMAAPHVAAAAALLRQARPGQTAAQTKSALVGTSKHLAGTETSAQGAGRLDIAAAARTTLTAQPSSISLGLADLTKPTIGGTATVTLHNGGDRPLTVDLAANDSAATVSASRVVIGAGQDSAVSVLVKAKRPEGVSDVSGWITATPDAGPAIHVPYLIAVRPLLVQASPDPSDGTSTVYIYSYAELGAAPVVTVTPPSGPTTTVTARPDYSGWYLAQVTGKNEGAYRLSVSARATTGQHLKGEGGFEVTPESTRKARWEPVGPNNEGGAITLSPTAPDQAVMAQYHKSGPWLTTDRGKTWTQLNRTPVVAEGFQPRIIVDAKRSDRWWMASADAGEGRSKIVRTEDRGRTWRVVALPSGFIEAFVADEQTRTLVAVTEAGMYVSTDAGDTWTLEPTGADGPVYWASFGGGELYLATFTGIWVRPGVTGPTKPIYKGGSLITGLAANGEVVAALEWGKGVVGSYDKGRTWSTLKEWTSGGADLLFSGTDLYFGTYQGRAHIGHNSGREWTEIAAPVPSANMLDYERWADGSVTLSQTSGIYRGSPDGTGFRRIGVQGQTIYGLAVSGNTLLAGADTGVYRTGLPIASPEWGGSGVEGYYGERTMFIKTSPQDPNIVWKVVRGVFDAFRVYRSGDGGNTWEEKGTGSEMPYSLEIHPADPNRVLIGFASLRGAGLFQTVDGGTHWKNLHHGMGFQAVAGDPSNPNRLWLGNPSGLYRSDDGGVTITKLADFPVSKILLDGSQLIVGGDAVRVSSDGGRTFRTADTGGLSIHVSDIICVGSALYAATDVHSPYGLINRGRGVLRSTDGGLTWHNVSTGLQNLDVTTLAVSPDSKHLYAGTRDGGVHRLSLLS